jgi:hypothetical protein
MLREEPSTAMVTVKGSLSLKAAVSTGTADSLSGAAIGELGLKQAAKQKARKIPQTKREVRLRDFIENSLDEIGKTRRKIP